MSIQLRLLLVALAHITFLVGAAGARIFAALAIPSPVGELLYFVVSPVVAGVAFLLNCAEP